MIFDPVSEEDLQKQLLLPEGFYQYQVVKSEDKVSKSGNEYIALTLKIWAQDGSEHLVFTNLALIKLLKHLCDVNNMQDEYKSGNIPAESFMFKSGGQVSIGIEPEKQNPNGGMYKAKNIVKDYIFAPHGSSMKPLPDVKNDFPDDEIPF